MREDTVKQSLLRFLLLTVVRFTACNIYYGIAECVVVVPAENSIRTGFGNEFGQLLNPKF